MPTDRLSTALHEGSLSLPDGPVLVRRPPAGYDLGALERGRVRILTGFRPDRDWWQAAGYEVVDKAADEAVTLVVVPRSKALARAMVAEACEGAGLVLVDGQRTDGADSLFKECRARLGDLPNVAKAHGRLFWFAASDVFADWAAPPPQPGPEGFVTTAGVFSDGAVDRGSALLAAALPGKMGPHVADLGAGWGYLSAAVLQREGVERVDLVEAEALSLDCAWRNLSDPRAVFHWADATTWGAARSVDAVVMNPPFHTGRAADPGLGRAFIAAAARLLKPQGSLWMVANRHLAYEGALRENFRNLDEIGGDSAFKLYHASRPVAGRTF